MCMHAYTYVLCISSNFSIENQTHQDFKQRGKMVILIPSKMTHLRLLFKWQCAKVPAADCFVIIRNEKIQ